MMRTMRGSVLVGLLLVLVAGVPLPIEAPVADAAERGDVALVKSLLQEGADVNAAQGDGMTALHWSAWHNEAALAELLVFAGANREPTTRLGGYTPLHLASQLGNAEVASALLEAGAAVSSFASTGVTPLHLAAEAGSEATVRALLEYGADVNERDRLQGTTPLMFAIARDRLEAVRVLITAGADVSLATSVVDYVERGKVDAVDRRRRTRIAAAAVDAPVAAARGGQVAGGAPATDPDARAGGTAASRSVVPEEVTAPEPGAAGAADTTVAKPKADPEPAPLSYNDLVGRQGGFTALHYAARDGRMEAATMLLHAGADLNAVTGGDRSSALLVALINGNYDLALMFLEQGADPSLVSEDGAGPLFAVLNNRWALRTWYPQPKAWEQQAASYLDVTRALLEAGAEVNQRVNTHIWYAAYNAGRMGVDFAGATPFWRAAYSLDVDAMKLLVEFGADPNIPSVKPASRQSARGAPDAEAKVEEDPSGLAPVETGGPAVYPLHAASGVGYGTSRVGQQHVHVPDGWLPAVRYLVEGLGGDVNVRDHDGYTAVHNAAARGDNEVIEYLAAQGADVTLVSRAGQTTVDMANGPQQRVQPFPETIALLESLGAKNNHKCVSC